MNLFLPLFLCFFIAQCCIFGLIDIQNRIVTAKYMPYKPSLYVQRAVVDSLDFEILKARKEEKYNDCFFTFSSADRIICELYEKIYTCDTTDEEYYTLYKLFDISLVNGIDFEVSKKRIKHIASCQFYNGNMPDFFNRDSYIVGSGTGMLLLPYVVAEYLNYSGDVEFLNTELCYNSYNSKPLCSFIKTQFQDTLYEHILRALNCVSLNGDGLVGIKYENSIFEKTDIDRECASIIATLIYFYGTEAFIEYIRDYKLKVYYLEKLQMLLDNISVKLETTFNANFNNVTNIKAGILYIFAQGQKKDDVMFRINRMIKEKDTMFFGLARIYQLAFSAYLISKNNTDTANLIFDNILKDTNGLSYFEKAIVKKIIYKKLFGIDFKCGLMKIKPESDSFSVNFDYNGKKISLNKYSNNSNGLIIDGLKFNNLDYICLKAYNKDITITL